MTNESKQIGGIKSDMGVSYRESRPVSKKFSFLALEDFNGMPIS